MVNAEAAHDIPELGESFEDAVLGNLCRGGGRGVVDTAGCSGTEPITRSAGPVCRVCEVTRLWSSMLHALLAAGGATRRRWGSRPSFRGRSPGSRPDRRRRAPRRHSPARWFVMLRSCTLVSGPPRVLLWRRPRLGRRGPWRRSRRPANASRCPTLWDSSAAWSLMPPASMRRCWGAFVARHRAPLLVDVQ